MDNVIAFPDMAFSGGEQGKAYCWICQKETPVRSMFCAHCGVVQPLRAVDHFTRLGVERRIDVDVELLEKQYKILKQTLSPERFSLRGLGERTHAAKQLEAVEEAYAILRDPVRRGRYWLSLHQKDVEEAEIANPLVAELRYELETVAEAAQCDRIAQKAGLALQDGVMGFMQALRAQNWQQANATLLELDGLEGILSHVRARRTQIAMPQQATPSASAGDRDVRGDAS